MTKFWIKSLYSCETTKFRDLYFIPSSRWIEFWRLLLKYLRDPTRQLKSTNITYGGTFNASSSKHFSTFSRVLALHSKNKHPCSFARAIPSSLLTTLSDSWNHKETEFRLIKWELKSRRLKFSPLINLVHQIQNIESLQLTFLLGITGEGSCSARKIVGPIQFESLLAKRAISITSSQKDKEK